MTCLVLVRNEGVYDCLLELELARETADAVQKSLHLTLLFILQVT
jgi:hypothetical protein